MSAEDRTFRSFEAAVDAFRRSTARDADGGATRARVFAAVEQRRRRAVTTRRTGIAFALVIAAALSGRAAWTAIGDWRSPPPPREAAVTTTPVTLRPSAAVAPRSPGARTSDRRGAEARRRPSRRRRGARLRAGARRALPRRRAGARARAVGRLPARVPDRDLRARGALQPGAVPRASRSPRRGARGSSSVRGRRHPRLPAPRGRDAPRLDRRAGLTFSSS